MNAERKIVRMRTESIDEKVVLSFVDVAVNANKHRLAAAAGAGFHMKSTSWPGTPIVFKQLINACVLNSCKSKRPHAHSLRAD